MYIVKSCHEDNTMRPSSSPQWPCDNMLALDDQWSATLPLVVQSQHIGTKPLWWWGGWAHWIVFMTSLYMYCAPWFVLAEHSCLHIDAKIMFWILKKYKLNFKRHLKTTSKAISDQNVFCRFQSWCWTVIQTMNSEDKTFLERFCVTESSNLIDLENFAVTGFTIMGRLGWYSPHQPKNDQISIIRVPSPNFYIQLHPKAQLHTSSYLWDLVV